MENLNKDIDIAKKVHSAAFFIGVSHFLLYSILGSFIFSTVLCLFLSLAPLYYRYSASDKSRMGNKLMQVGGFLGLGYAISLGSNLIFYSSMHLLGIYVISLSVYHLFEYLFVFLYHPAEVKFASFLFTHSREYTYAIALSFFDTFAGHLLFSDLKDSYIGRIGSLIGLAAVITGHYFRIAAFFTAKSNFHHLIRYSKDMRHVLVTHGVYSFSRHPSYFGWSVWAVGT